MKKLFSLKRKEDVLEVLKGENYGSSKFRKALEKACMSNKFVKYLAENELVIEQGYGRTAKIPVDIVEDVMGSVTFSKRIA